jgi:uncharacterized protein with von Willebrand factor type A (vWA) domain
MAARFTYSRWDGTQKGFDLDADALFDELNDDLLYHGDINSALRRLMQQGMNDRNGERLQGLRELMEKLRQERQDRLDRSDLGGVYQEIADELNDIVDEERHAIENATNDARNSGDERRAEAAQHSADERNFRLDMLPNDLAGKVRELSAYDFESREAAQRFEQLMDKLREQLMQQMVDQMSSAVQNMTPEDMARMKDMMAALNEMIERQQRGEDPQFEQFMEQFGDFFPENPQSLEELLQQMAQRMAAMQAMLNSMTPEQRAQLQQLSDQLLEDMDLRWQMDQLGQNLRGMFPQMQWNQSYDFEGHGPDGHGPGDADHAGARRSRSAREPVAERHQPGRARRGRHGPRARADGRRRGQVAGALAELTKMLQDAGLIEQKEGRLELTPKGLRKIGQRAADLFSKLDKDKTGQHQMDRFGQGHERTYETKQYEYGDPFNLDLQRTIRNAMRRNGARDAGQALTGRLRDRAHRAHHQVVDGADARSVAVDADARQLPAGEEGGDGVALAHHIAVPARLHGHRRLQRDGPHPHRGASARGQLGLRVRHQHAARLHARPPDAGAQTGTKQIIMITDGEPTAHITPRGDVFFNYPPVQETVEATCSRSCAARATTSASTPSCSTRIAACKTFIEKLTSINRGRAFFTTNENLGDYVLVDFIEHKKQLARGRNARRAG